MIWAIENVSAKAGLRYGERTGKGVGLRGDMRDDQKAYEEGFTDAVVGG